MKKAPSAFPNRSWEASPAFTAMLDDLKVDKSTIKPGKALTVKKKESPRKGGSLMSTRAAPFESGD